MRAFTTRTFQDWAEDQDIPEDQLADCVREIEQGLIDADLGGHLIKKRVARAGQGKSGGFRTILAFQKEQRAFFLYGFAKNERDNITPKELKALRILGNEFLSYDDETLQRLLSLEELFEIEVD
jgi:hypothetical protein